MIHSELGSITTTVYIIASNLFGAHAKNSNTYTPHTSDHATHMGLNLHVFVCCTFVYKHVHVHVHTPY